MVTYQLINWINAGLHQKRAAFFQTDQVVPSILVYNTWEISLTKKVTY